MRACPPPQSPNPPGSPSTTHLIEYSRLSPRLLRSPTLIAQTLSYRSRADTHAPPGYVRRSLAPPGPYVYLLGNYRMTALIFSNIQSPQKQQARPPRALCSSFSGHLQPPRCVSPKFGDHLNFPFARRAPTQRPRIPFLRVAGEIILDPTCPSINQTAETLRRPCQKSNAHPYTAPNLYPTLRVRLMVN